MSDHEGFEMLDETFGVRAASEDEGGSSSANSPLQPGGGGVGAGWDRFRSTDIEAEQIRGGNEVLTRSSAAKDPRSRSAAGNRSAVETAAPSTLLVVSRAGSPLPLEQHQQHQQHQHQQHQHQYQHQHQPPVNEAEEELVGMGFDREHVVRALKECGRGEGWKESAITLLLEPEITTSAGRSSAGHGFSDPAASASQCPICLNDIQAEEMFTVDCKEQHTFCVNCLHRHCSVQLLDSGLIPACPLSNTSCGHELSHEEVERVFLLKTYSWASEAGKGGSTDAAKVEQQSDRRALETCNTLLTRRGLESTGAVPCVSPECGNWMVPEGGGQRVKCTSCLIEFCGSCKRAPYHYTASCDEVVSFGRAWSAWLTEGKAAFLQVMAAQDDEHRALLDQHNKRKQQHELAVKEAERLRLEYDRMEDWKESRCRCCPKCGRVVEKLSGCDLMVCGVDAHGGNVQNGCGVKFMWTQAPPYKGDRGERKTTPFTEQEPASAARSRHFIAEGIPLRCDRCHRDVVGPLFRCVHCPSFACCLECQDMVCADPKHVHHTFRLIDGSSPEAT